MAMADGLDFDTVEKLLLRSSPSPHQKSFKEKSEADKTNAKTQADHRSSSHNESDSDYDENRLKKSRSDSEEPRSPRRPRRRESSRSIERPKKDKRESYRNSTRKHYSRYHDHDDSDDIEEYYSHRSKTHRSHLREPESRRTRSRDSERRKRQRSRSRNNYLRKHSDVSRSRSHSTHRRRAKRSHSHSSSHSISPQHKAPSSKYARPASPDDGAKNSRTKSQPEKLESSKEVLSEVREEGSVVPAVPMLGRMNDEDMRRKREIEEARRDDMTVLVLNLNLKSTELDVYEFFSEHAGKVRDIQLIKDQRSGRAKGVAYVEFYTQAAVIKALALSGQAMKGQPVRVQASQAEKNRAAKAARVQQAEVTDGPMRVYVGGLIEALSHITDLELKQFFAPFGEIISVDIQRDPYTGRSKGYAFIQFKRASEAKEAMAVMNGYVLGGRPLKVGYASEPSKPTVPAGIDPIAVLQQQSAISNEAIIAQQLAVQQFQQQNDQQDSDRLDDDGGGLLSGPGSKLALMQKLQRDKPLNNNTVDPMLAMAEQEAKLLADRALANGILHHNQRPANETSNIILSNMFAASEVNLEEDPTFFVDIMDEVRSECSRYGAVLKVWVDERALDGRIWIKFEGVDQAVAAYKALNGRYFGGNTISVEFVSDAVWLAR